MGGRRRTLSPMMAPPKTKTRYTLLRFMKICMGHDPGSAWVGLHR